MLPHRQYSSKYTKIINFLYESYHLGAFFAPHTKNGGFMIKTEQRETCRRKPARDRGLRFCTIKSAAVKTEVKTYAYQPPQPAQLSVFGIQ